MAGLDLPAARPGTPIDQARKPIVRGQFNRIACRSSMVKAVRIGNCLTEPLMQDSLIRQPDVLSRTGIRSKQYLYRLIERGTFPRPLRIGPRAVAWRASDIDAWLASLPDAGPEPKEVA